MLDVSNSRCYRPRDAVCKHAVLCWEPCRYVLRWGEQIFDGPHMRVFHSEGDYGAAFAAFFTTHRPEPTRPDHYVKFAPVRAAQAAAPFTLTTWIDGRIEMVAAVPVGAFVVQNLVQISGGELYAMDAGQFHTRYEDDSD